MGNAVQAAKYSGDDDDEIRSILRGYLDGKIDKEDAFTNIFDILQPRLRSYLRGVRKLDEFSYKDAAQEVLCRIYKYCHRFDLDRKILPLIYKMMRNAASEQIRQRGGAMKFDALEAHEPVTEPKLDKAIALREVLDMLNEAERELLLLRFGQHSSFEEIAAIMDLSVTTTKERVYRAKRNFCKLYIGRR